MAETVKVELRGAHWREPCLYVWRRGDRVLYVGCSMKGATRALDPNHHRLGRNVLPDDVIEIEFFPGADAPAIYATEARRIRDLKPEQNAAGAGSDGGRITPVTEIRLHPRPKKRRAPRRNRYDLAREAMAGRGILAVLAS